MDRSICRNHCRIDPSVFCSCKKIKGTFHDFLEIGQIFERILYYRVPKGPGVFKGRGNWGTLRIPFGKIGEP